MIEEREQAVNVVLARGKVVWEENKNGLRMRART